MKGLSYAMRGELHCHNCYSNGRDSPILPLESPIRPLDQLKFARKNNLDFLFVTNHNTTNGYSQLIACRKDHPELREIEVYPGEEVSVLLPNGLYGHVLAWGVTGELKGGMPFGEAVDEIRSQGAISCAAHPYGFACYMRENARSCDMVEVFNSGNIDRYSNMRAYDSARAWKKFGTVGSDVHFLGDIGKCVTVVNSETGLDDVLDALRHGRYEVEKVSYNTREEIIDSFRYQLSDAEGLFGNIRESCGRAAESAARFMARRFAEKNSSVWTGPISRLMMACARNISMKINMYGYDESLINLGDGYTIEYSGFGRMLAEVFLPLDVRKFGHVTGEGYLGSGSSAEALNRLNASLRKE